MRSKDEQTVFFERLISLKKAFRDTPPVWYIRPEISHTWRFLNGSYNYAPKGMELIIIDNIGYNVTGTSVSCCLEIVLSEILYRNHRIKERAFPGFLGEVRERGQLKLED